MSVSTSQSLRDLVSHRVTFDFENGYHLSGYVAEVYGEDEGVVYSTKPFRTKKAAVAAATRWAKAHGNDRQAWYR